MPLPSVGRIVHYIGPDNRQPCQAAIITEVAAGEIVGLTVMPPGQMGYPVMACRRGEPVGGLQFPAPCSWHWPEMV